MKKYVEENYMNFKYTHHSVLNYTIDLFIEPIFDHAICPDCGVKSTKIHVYTNRSFFDIPFKDKMVNVNTHTRIFKCKNKACNTKTFSESLSFIEKNKAYSNRLINLVLELSVNFSIRKTVEALKAKNIIIKRTAVNKIINEGKKKKLMTKLIKENKAKTIEHISNGKLDLVHPLPPELTDTILESVEARFDFISDINNIFTIKTKHKDAMAPDIFITSSISARLKQQAATSSVPLAITSPKLLEKLKMNLMNLDTDTTYFTEGILRDFINRYSENEIMDSFNKFLVQMIKGLENRPTLHILDCTKIPVNFNNTNYEGAGVVTEGDGEKVRGYKAGVLRGCLKDGGVIEEVCLGPINTHDLQLVKPMILNSKNLKPKDVLIMDRGFIDLEFIKALSEEKQVTVIIPARNNMDIFTEAISIAKEANDWSAHPTRKRQKVSYIESLDNAWIKNGKTTNFSACVIKIEKDYNFEYSDTEYLSQDEEYIYIVILTTNKKLKANRIIKTYSKRTQIEKHFSQLKDFWKLCEFKSTKYLLIAFYVMTVFCAYNYYQLFKNLEVGKEYKKVSLPVAVNNQKRIFKVNRYKFIIVTDNVYGLFDFTEILNMFSNFSKEVQNKITAIIDSG